MTRGKLVAAAIGVALFGAASDSIASDGCSEDAPLEVVLTGGVVAFNPTIGEILSQRLGRTVTVPPHPQLTGALGAAIAARSQFSKQPPG